MLNHVSKICILSATLFTVPWPSFTPLIGFAMASLLAVGVLSHKFEVRIRLSALFTVVCHFIYLLLNDSTKISILSDFNHISTPNICNFSRSLFIIDPRIYSQVLPTFLNIRLAGDNRRRLPLGHKNPTKKAWSSCNLLNRGSAKPIRNKRKNPRHRARVSALVFRIFKILPISIESQEQSSNLCQKRDYLIKASFFTNII